jgi:hypothetical protein
MFLEGLHGVEQDRFAVYLHELFGHDGVHAFACSACQDEGYVVTLFHGAASV